MVLARTQDCALVPFDLNGIAHGETGVYKLSGTRSGGRAPGEVVRYSTSKLDVLYVYVLFLLYQGAISYVGFVPHITFAEYSSTRVVRVVPEVHYRTRSRMRAPHLAFLHSLACHPCPLSFHSYHSLHQKETIVGV